MSHKFYHRYLTNFLHVLMKVFFRLYLSVKSSKSYVEISFVNIIALRIYDHIKL